DDELAIIGSANCNRRGWESDSEVVAVILDKPNSVTNCSFAQTLRAKLWAEHLGVDEVKVRDGLASKDCWPKSDSDSGDFWRAQPSGKCCVQWYDLSKETGDRGDWDAIDPGDGGLRACP